MFDHAVRDLDTDYKRFERDPETHPLYQKEWKIFWQKRSEELANGEYYSKNFLENQEPLQLIIQVYWRNQQQFRPFCVCNSECL